MKKRIIAVFTVVMMLFTLVPGAAMAASRVPAGEEYLEGLEYAYYEYIGDRNKYCDEVWAEIQAVYKEARQAYIEEDGGYWLYISEDSSYYEDAIYAYPMDPIDYETELEYLGALTWVKSGSDLETLKTKYLKEINDEYKEFNKSDYNDYNWDMIQDCLYIGKKQIKEADTFREANAGYFYAKQGMEYATDKETLKEYSKEVYDELDWYVNLFLDPDDYSEVQWKKIKDKLADAKVKINGAELESDIEKYYEQYGKEIAALAGKTFPISDAEYEAFIQEEMKPVTDYYYSMDMSKYSQERQWEAEEYLWELEEEVYEAQSRAELDKTVAKYLNKLKNLPTKEQDLAMVKNTVFTVKAAGVTGTSIKVTWNANKNFDGYILYRSTSKSGTYKKIAEFYSGSKKSYTDTKLTFGKKYYYKIKGVKSIDWVDKYTKLSMPAMGTPKLMAPSVKLSKAGSADVQVKWNAVTGAKGYEIYRSTSVNGAVKKVKTIKSGKTVSWKDTSTKKGKQYCYKMRSYTTVDGKKKYSSYSTIKTIKR